MRREIRRFATGKHPDVLGIPEVVGIAVVRVEPAFIAVMLHVEHVRVAVRVDSYKRPSVPPPIEYSLGCIEFCI